ncbi:hypothetical protein FRC10_001332 [Ceratobasidium sp. 414]|nr:hypothetical protein FRC10_001332 [Ceratobasidium sp. 414]
MPYYLVPDETHPNWLEKLNEWSDKARAEIAWGFHTDDAHKHHATPSINGAVMHDCVGVGISRQEAKGKAAEQLSKKGKLVSLMLSKVVSVINI